MLCFDKVLKKRQQMGCFKLNGWIDSEVFLTVKKKTNDDAHLPNCPIPWPLLGCMCGCPAPGPVGPPPPPRWPT